MSDTKLNKDGLEPGKLVSPKDHTRVLNEQRLAKRKADAAKAAKAEK